MALVPRRNRGPDGRRVRRRVDVEDNDDDDDDEILPQQVSFLIFNPKNHNIITYYIIQDASTWR